MVKRDPVLSLTNGFISGDVSRREFMKRAAALGLTGTALGAFASQADTATAIAAAYTPGRLAERAAAQLAEVPARADARRRPRPDRRQVRRVQPLESVPPRGEPSARFAHDERAAGLLQRLHR